MHTGIQARSKLNRKVSPDGPRDFEKADVAKLDVIQEQAKELVAAQAEIESLKRLLREGAEDKTGEWKSTGD